MAVTSADNQALSRIVEVYHVGPDEPIEADNADEEALEGAAVGALESLGAASTESRAYLRVRRSTRGPDLFLPLEAVDHVNSGAVILRLRRDEVVGGGWERQPHLVQLAEARLARPRP